METKPEMINNIVVSKTKQEKEKSRINNRR